MATVRLARIFSRAKLSSRRKRCLTDDFPIAVELALVCPSITIDDETFTYGLYQDQIIIC